MNKKDSKQEQSIKASGTTGSTPNRKLASRAKPKAEINLDNVTEMARAKLAQLGKTLPGKTKTRFSDLSRVHGSEVQTSTDPFPRGEPKMAKHQSVQQARKSPVKQTKNRPSVVSQGNQGTSKISKQMAADSEIDEFIKQKQTGGERTRFKTFTSPPKAAQAATYSHQRAVAQPQQHQTNPKAPKEANDQPSIRQTPTRSRPRTNTVKAAQKATASTPKSAGGKGQRKSEYYSRTAQRNTIYGTKIYGQHNRSRQDEMLNISEYLNQGRNGDQGLMSNTAGSLASSTLKSKESQKKVADIKTKASESIKDKYNSYQQNKDRRSDSQASLPRPFSPPGADSSNPFSPIKENSNSSPQFRKSKSLQVSDRLFNHAASKMSALQKKKRKISVIQSMDEGIIQKSENPFISKTPNRKQNKLANDYINSDSANPKQDLGESSLAEVVERSQSLIDDQPEPGTVKMLKTVSFTPQGTNTGPAMSEATGPGGPSRLPMKRAESYTNAPAHKNRISKMRTQLAIGKMKPAGEEGRKQETNQKSFTMKDSNSEKASLEPKSHPPEIVVNHPSEDQVQKASQKMLSGQEDAQIDQNIRSSVNPFAPGLSQESSPPKRTLSVAGDFSTQIQEEQEEDDLDYNLKKKYKSEVEEKQNFKSKQDGHTSAQQRIKHDKDNDNSAIEQKPSGQVELNKDAPEENKFPQQIDNEIKKQLKPVVTPSITKQLKPVVTDSDMVVLNKVHEYVRAHGGAANLLKSSIALQEQTHEPKEPSSESRTESRIAAKRRQTAKAKLQTWVDEQEKLQKCEEQAKEMLEEVYRKAQRQYTYESRRLERRGTVDHLTANIKFKNQLLHNQQIQGEELDQFEEEINNTLNAIHRRRNTLLGQQATEHPLVEQPSKGRRHTGLERPGEKTKQSNTNLPLEEVKQQRQPRAPPQKAPNSQGEGQTQQSVQDKNSKTTSKNPKNNMQSAKPQSATRRTASQDKTANKKITQRPKSTTTGRKQQGQNKKQIAVKQTNKATQNTKEESKTKSKNNPYLSNVQLNEQKLKEDEIPAARPTTAPKKQMKQQKKLNAADEHEHRSHNPNDLDCAVCQTDKMNKKTRAQPATENVSKDAKNSAKNDPENPKEKEKNKKITDKMEIKAQEAAQQESAHSDGLVDDCHTSGRENQEQIIKEQGQLITINIDIGGEKNPGNFRILQGKTNQSAEEIALSFCKMHKLGWTMRKRIIPQVQEKLDQLNAQTIEYKKHTKRREEGDNQKGSMDQAQLETLPQSIHGPAADFRSRETRATAQRLWKKTTHAQVLTVVKQLDDEGIYERVNSKVRQNHKRNHFNYESLHADGFLKHFVFAKEVEFIDDEIINDKECAYLGQVCPSTSRPDGLGVAVDEDGNLYEGMFQNGQISSPILKATREGTTANLAYPDGRKYDIYHQISEEYKDDFTILDFIKGFRHQTEGVSQKQYNRQDKSEFLKETNYRKYFKLIKQEEFIDPQKSGVFVKSKTKLADLERIFTFNDKCLGSGSFGKVYLATNKRDAKIQFAVKEINTAGIPHADVVMLQNEISIMQKVDHPNIVKYFETYYDHDKVYLCMELCTGGDFFQKIVDKGKILCEEEAAVYFADILRALLHCHSSNIIHRDIKPDNIMIGDEGAVKLVDFGFAIRSKVPKEQGGEVRGTPFYIAPEVLQQNYGKQCDIWSLGVVLYELLTGKVPFDGATLDELFAKIQTGKFEAPTGLSATCIDLIQKMICVRTEERFTSKQCLEHPWITENVQRHKLKIQRFSSSLDTGMLSRLRKFRGKSVLKRAALNILVKGLKPSEMEHQQVQFQRIDADLSGFIEGSELQRALQLSKEESGMGMSDHEINDIIAQLDYARNGKINFTEFLAATIDVRRFLTGDRLEAIFSAFDIYDKGVITTQDIRIAFSKFGRELSAQDLHEIIKEHDNDGRAGLSKDEFKAMMLEDEVADKVDVLDDS